MEHVQIDRAAIARFCEANRIHRLALFGSVLRNDFGAASDVDVLVQFEAGRKPGYFGFARMADELSGIVGHPVDLRTPEELSPHFRDKVMQESRAQYDRG